MKDYDAYLFDWDGTLANSHDMWLEVIRGQLQRFDKHLSDHEIVQQLFGRYGDGMRELGFTDQQIKELGKEVHAAGVSKMPLISLYGGATDVLRELHAQGKKLAVVTATYREIIDAAVTHHELIELFDVTVSGDEVKAQKPNPDGLQMALKTLGISPDRAVMIGDSRKDILAGQNAGTDTILFFPPEHASQHDIAELKGYGPTFIINSWQEMLNQLR